MMGQPNGLSTYRLNDLVALRRHEQGDIIIDFGKGRIWNYKGVEIIGHLNKKGYLQITLSENGVPFTMQKHRAIYVCYHGINAIVIGQELEIDHADGNKLNNSIRNLKQITASENCRNPNTLLRGETAPHARFTNETAEYIRELYLSGGFTCRRIGKLFGVTTQAIEAIIHNKSYASETEAARLVAEAIKNKPRSQRYMGRAEA